MTVNRETLERTAPREEAGQVVAVQLCPGHRLPMQPVDEALALEGRGLQGDGHNKARGSRQVLLMDLETLEALDLAPGIIKENLTLRGIAVNQLPPGQRLQVGAEVVLEVTKPCEPCFRMDEIRPGLQAVLEGQRGMLAHVITGGPIRPGDSVQFL